MTRHARTAHIIEHLIKGDCKKAAMDKLMTLLVMGRGLPTDDPFKECILVNLDISMVTRKWESLRQELLNEIKKEVTKEYV